jgi:hypothetical protein
MEIDERRGAERPESVGRPEGDEVHCMEAIRWRGMNGQKSALQTIMNHKRIALITGANKGIGFGGAEHVDGAFRQRTGGGRKGSLSSFSELGE